MGNERLF